MTPDTPLEELKRISHEVNRCIKEATIRANNERLQAEEADRQRNMADIWATELRRRVNELEIQAEEMNRQFRRLEDTVKQLPQCAHCRERNQLWQRT